MSTLADLLKPEHVALEPQAQTRSTAIREIAGLLEHDVQVLDWGQLYEKVSASAPCIAGQGAAFCSCIPHARTPAVLGMVMSVGRFNAGLCFAEVPQPVRYMFCLVVPPESDTDYLRIIGLLARIVKDPKSEQQIYTAPTAEEFIGRLVRLEAKL